MHIPRRGQVLDDGICHGRRERCCEIGSNAPVLEVPKEAGKAPSPPSIKITAHKSPGRGRVREDGEDPGLRKIPRVAVIIRHYQIRSLSGMGFLDLGTSGWRLTRYSRQSFDALFLLLDIALDRHLCHVNRNSFTV